MSRWVEETLEERFWKYVDKKGPYPDPKKYPKLKTRCWIWTAGYFHDGYGQFNIKEGKPRAAHRVAYELVKGPLGKKLSCHKCDNKGCVRPSHLFKGTTRDNHNDCNKKGRRPKGTKHWKSLLTPQKVKKIRFYYKVGLYNGIELGRLFAVTPDEIYAIVHRKLWKHI